MVDCSLTDFAKDGALLLKSALTPCIADLEAGLAGLPTDSAGIRIYGIASLRPLHASTGLIGGIASSIAGRNTLPVRAILFDKSEQNNWSLAWHQDRTICVKEKREASDFGPWTIKRGMHHVAPPYELLTKMITLRAHLDDVSVNNAPLLISPGSHKFGRIPVSDIDNVVQRCGTKTCLAEAGDVWLYSTPILHASEAASPPTRRRVLQIDFSADTLPNGLEWLGV
ncbi:phytanoyl-CoA dioxygenase family protein [Novosphingobium sp. Chol11]|uniref:phytanoyl-CoA dioxygenase family protein n=1 Tax=Novosphingobium sp. Chol11 TaxID=1385763 RepID=UPI0025FE1834|nr:phytanoyl-CoA dioxygenase family protein [Novosphingobium sp. Chol11]